MRAEFCIFESNAPGLKANFYEPYVDMPTREFTFDGTCGFRIDRCTKHSAEGSKTRSCRDCSSSCSFSSDPAVSSPNFVGEKRESLMQKVQDPRSDGEFEVGVYE